MRRFVITIFIIACVVAFAGTTFAEKRDAKAKQIYFGESYHKSPAGISLTEMSISWDETGVTKFKYILTAYKGKTTWEDVYFVSTSNEKTGIVYRMSDNRKMKQEFCYLECLHKREDNTIYYTPHAGPFDIESGQVWFVFSFGNEKVYVIWEMKTNKLDWYKASDKQAPPMM